MNSRRYLAPLPLGGDEGPPWSKGLMARALAATGLPTTRAYELARLADADLMAQGEHRLDLDRLATLAVELLGETEGTRTMRRLRRLQALQHLDVPIVLLVGGATGTGKSTIATEAAHRLGITRVTSTDFIRQTMRAFFARDFMPSVHYSSFEAGLALTKAEEEETGDPRLLGFFDQTRNVLVGVEAALDRVEAFVIPGTTVAGVAGLVLLFGGLVATFLPSGQGMFPSSAQQSGDLAWGVGTVLAALITAGVGMFFMARHFGSLPFFNKMVLKGTPEEVADITTMGMADTAGSSQVKLGQTGVAITRMGPAGRVEIDGRVIDAVSDFGFIQPGTAIRVSSVDGMRVGVERDLRTPPTA